MKAKTNHAVSHPTNGYLAFGQEVQGRQKGTYSTVFVLGIVVRQRKDRQRLTAEGVRRIIQNLSEGIGIVFSPSC